jgi:hypothetical protein
MHSSLTEMFASAHRDELHRRASQHRLARDARRSRQSRRHAAARNSPGPAPTRLLNLRFAERRSQVRPAA